MRTLSFAALCGVLVAGGLSAAPVPKMKERTTEQKLVGKWKLVKTDNKLPGTYDFFIDFKGKGELSFTRVPAKGGRTTVADGKYTVIGDDKVDWKVTESGRERGETAKIKMLTADKLVIEDPAGIKEEFERVVEKKEEPKKD
jgi:uncharacterized protein (TIGR03066 family)